MKKIIASPPRDNWLFFWRTDVLNLPKDPEKNKKQKPIFRGFYNKTTQEFILPDAYRNKSPLVIHHKDIAKELGLDLTKNLLGFQIRLPEDNTSVIEINLASNTYGTPGSLNDLLTMAQQITNKFKLENIKTKLILKTDSIEVQLEVQILLHNLSSTTPIQVRTQDKKHRIAWTGKPRPTIQLPPLTRGRTQ